MELHDSLRALVDDHGRSILDDADGFRGVLDDVLEEDQASTGDINLLVDAVRFDAVNPLASMIDGGADPSLAVEEAGQRLARNRGGADTQLASWAVAVLGYAVGKVPVDVVRRHGAHRTRGTSFSGPPTGPPVVSPPSPQQSPYQSPPATVWPGATGSAPGGSVPSGPPSITPGYGSAPQPSYPIAQGYPATGYSGAQPARRSSKGPLVWVAAAVAGIVVVGGGITGIVVATSGDDDPGISKKSDGPDEPDPPEVDVTPEGINSRYDTLASNITAGTSECVAGDPGAGQAEVIDCTVNAGQLRLITYEDEAAQSSARAARLDHRAGTLSADNGSTAYYEFDPDRAGTSDPAVVYWDNSPTLQSAQFTGMGSAKIDTIATLYDATSPRIKVPSAPSHAVLREFININMEVSGCTRQRTFFVGETEESKCESGAEGIAVNVGRYDEVKGVRKDRNYYKGKYEAANVKGGGGIWKLGGENAGAYYAYADAGSATLYWDWNKADCNCYGVAWNFEGDLEALEAWWPSDE